MRFTASITAVTSILLSQSVFAAEAPGHGGFIGVTGSAISTDDMDGYGSAFKLVFGPNITENLALEFGFMDLGEMSFDDPTIRFTEETDTAPSFTDTDNGDVERFNSSAKAIYTGTKSFHAQGILLNLRYNYDLTDTLDVFVKGGANAWMAKVEKVRIEAFNEDNTFTRTDAGENETSGVELITGIGLMWEPLNHFVIRGEYELTSLDSFYIQLSTFDLYSLGIQYEF